MAGSVPNTRNWKALEMSDLVGRNRRLIVTGEVEIIGTGTRAALKLHSPQGFNPRDLLLDLVITSPGGIQGQIARFVTVNYSQKTLVHQYDEVDVLWDGQVIERIKVVPVLTAAAAKPARRKKRARG